MRTPLTTPRTSRRPGRRAASAVELALTLPFLTTLMGGAIEAGWYLYQRLEVVNAARDGARMGAWMRRADDPVGVAEARTRAALTDAGLDGAGATVNVTVTLDGPIGQDVMEVDVSLVHSPVIDLVPSIGTIDTTARMWMRWPS